MNGYSKITSKPRSVDLPDHIFPSLSQPQESPNPTPKDEQKGGTIKAHEQIPWQEKDRCKDGQMSGLALTRNFSSTSHRFKAGENSHGSSTLRRAFSMRKPSAVAEGYWRIPDTADGDGDGDLFDGEEQQQQHVKSSWKKKGRILRACKRLFKL